ncbi:MAG: glutamate-1-semialdehyde 2,1-aminomutase [Thermodesulfobacteriota bacterium]
MNRNRSDILFERATAVIPGGVNSPVRACKSVGASPVFIRRGEGCLLTDEDGNTYIDYVGSWGPLILGHRHPEVVQTIRDVLERGTSFGAPVDLEIELAELVMEAFPSIEMVRMVNSGTEATMSAIRLARGFTGRNYIIKFDGCYHGHADSLLVAAGSGVATLGIPGSPGVPPEAASQTLSLVYNDIDGFRQTMNAMGDRIAAVIVEPVAGNMGFVMPIPGFLEALRSETQACGALLIFDEVMTGFRVARGGAQELFGIRPDVTTLGKIIGGGLPVGAYGGRKDIMMHIAPQGPVYQAGTLSGNPLAMAAGIATLKALQSKGIYAALDRNTERLCTGFDTAARRAGIPLQTAHLGSMGGLFFTDRQVTNFDLAKTSDTNRYARFYRSMLDAGVYLAPSQFEAFFVSVAHEQRHIDATIEAAARIFEEIARG